MWMGEFGIGDMIDLKECCIKEEFIFLFGEELNEIFISSIVCISVFDKSLLIILDREIKKFTF